MSARLPYLGLLLVLVLAPWIIPIIGDAFWLSVLTEIIIWSCFAASINFLFGYVGLLSFGQALFLVLGCMVSHLGSVPFNCHFGQLFSRPL